MNPVDWVVLVLTMGSFVVLGSIKARKVRTLDEFLLGDQSLPWYHVGFSLMATQASAITFLSAPGQGYVDGMRFVQFYLGLPLAMILICVVFIPIYYKLKVYTAYEFLGQRFDIRVRTFTALLFLLSRGFSTGISIYAPSLILATIFKWDITVTNVLMGGIVLIYSILGGTKGISNTHLQQMMFVTFSLFFVAYFVFHLLPDDICLDEALTIAGKFDKMTVLDLNFNIKEKYNLWSGVVGGFFLQLSYFGTDQSQVGRYLTGKSVTESRMGLILNGFLKIPMQFFIVLIGVLVFVFYYFNPRPLFFNENALGHVQSRSQKVELQHLNQQFSALEEQRLILIKKDIVSVVDQKHLVEIEIQEKELKNRVSEWIQKSKLETDTNDVNYIFLYFILHHLPHGFVGLLIAVIFSASMGSIASAYNSLAATSLVDVIKVYGWSDKIAYSEVRLTQWLTFFWGIFCILVAGTAHRFGSSMIELVNILGSWFYGVILGIFIVAFFIPKLFAKEVFWAAVISEILIIFIWYLDRVAYLWLNAIGVILVVVWSVLLKLFVFKSKSEMINNDF